MGMGDFGLDRVREGLADPEVPKNEFSTPAAGAAPSGIGQATPSFVSSATAGASAIRPPRPVDQLRDQLRQQAASTTPPQPQWGPAAPPDWEQAAKDRLRALKTSQAGQPAAPTPPIANPRQFSGPSNDTMMALHRGMGTAGAVNRMMAPGGLAHVIDFAAGRHLRLGTTPIGQTLAAGQRADRAAAPKTPKPPRISG